MKTFQGELKIEENLQPKMSGTANSAQVLGRRQLRRAIARVPAHIVGQHGLGHCVLPGDDALGIVQPIGQLAFPQRPRPAASMSSA
jgi:hypothetical protein